jgi:ATP-dependent Clp protease ATP-binding subunit ClpB
MDFEKYADRARGFAQSAHSLAVREGHQQFTAEHLLKVLLDDCAPTLRTAWQGFRS